MRGDGVGVGDVGAVSRGARGRRHAADGDDGGIEGRQHEPGMVSRWGYVESASFVELCRDRRGLDDRVRQQLGDSASHGEGSDGAHGMRGIGLGVGDVGEMQDGSWGNSNSKNHYVNGAEDSELQPRMVS